MATDQSFAAFILDQLNLLDDIILKKMFGEYGLFYDGKMVGIVADNQVFIKDTELGRSVAEETNLQSPYPGAKPYLLIENIDNKEMLRDLIVATHQVIPYPKPKKKKT